MVPQDRLDQLTKAVYDLVHERDWHQFHTPKNLSAKISIEAAELLEILVWTHEKDVAALIEKNKQEIKHELADVMISLLMFCNATNLDLYEAVLEKLEEIKKKYPVDQVKGKPYKYTYYTKK